MRGRDDVWVVELGSRYEDGPWSFGVDVLELRGEPVSRETVHVTEGWPAPEWRAAWRAAPPG
ncbi:hypothetical protein GCU56_08525 [Geodermatophilus sabuli]|uniref:Uncharacterized protein n=1 Tax=Geodermatophilus sabuli TaxID=1564158 RepID=A0A7K3W147_9ACTN|nr:hypothetical protein [Geodermatophilus sabuli]NEK57914.1 hypothetical protein [Geodermatophilus sabuli]